MSLSKLIHSTRYLEFWLVKELPKTNVYFVVNRSKDTHLGEIRWFPTWRQYTFMPEPETIWNKDCLRQVVEFLEEIERERRKQ